MGAGVVLNWKGRNSRARLRLAVASPSTNLIRAAGSLYVARSAAYYHPDAVLQ